MISDELGYWLLGFPNVSIQLRRRYNLQTAKAFCHLHAFQDLLSARDVKEAVSGLKWWYNRVCHSRIPEMIDVAKSIKRNWDGVVAYLETRLTNGPAEAINGIIPDRQTEVPPLPEH